MGGEREVDLGRRGVAPADLGRGAEGDDAPVDHHGDAVGQRLGLVHEVGGEEDRLAQRAEVLDRRPRLAAGRRVEAGGRLVEEEQVGVADEGEGEVQAAPLAAREQLDALGSPCRPGPRARRARRPGGGAGSSARTWSGPPPPSARPGRRPPAGRCRRARAAPARRPRGRGRARAPRRRCGRGSPRGSRSWWSCPRRWVRGGRRPPRRRRRRRCRAPPPRRRRPCAGLRSRSQIAWVQGRIPGAGPVVPRVRTWA